MTSENSNSLWHCGRAGRRHTDGQTIKTCTGPTTSPSPAPPSRARSKFSSASHLASFDKAVCDETRVRRDGECQRLEVDAIDNMRRKVTGKSVLGFILATSPFLSFFLSDRGSVHTKCGAARIKRRRLMFICDAQYVSFADVGAW